MGQVALGYFTHRQRPGYTQARIVKADTAFGRGFVEPSVQIKQFSFALQYLKPMSTSFRDEQGIRTLRVKFGSVPVKKGPRSSPKIHSYVEYPPLQAPDPLSLSMRRMLKVESAGLHLHDV